MESKIKNSTKGDDNVVHFCNDVAIHRK